MLILMLFIFFIYCYIKEIQFSEIFIQRVQSIIFLKITHDREMVARKRTLSMGSEGSDASDHFVSINERPVDDISFEFFYKPHSLILMFLCVCGITWTAFTRDQTNHNSNIVTGLLAVTVFFMILSVLTLPNGPFTRPHPALWRCVLGLSILYLLLVQFLLQQDWHTVR